MESLSPQLKPVTMILYIFIVHYTTYRTFLRWWWCSALGQEKKQIVEVIKTGRYWHEKIQAFSVTHTRRFILLQFLFLPICLLILLFNFKQVQGCKSKMFWGKGCTPHNFFMKIRSLCAKHCVCVCMKKSSMNNKAAWLKCSSSQKIFLEHPPKLLAARASIADGMKMKEPLKKYMAQKVIVGVVVASERERYSGKSILFPWCHIGRVLCIG